MFYQPGLADGQTICFLLPVTQKTVLCVLTAEKIESRLIKSMPALSGTSYKHYDFWLFYSSQLSDTYFQVFCVFDVLFSLMLDWSGDCGDLSL